ncbi:MAG: hypothetical protein H3C47_03855 [Candidatus Cloacimonetes bacterium]|nr:hypothetical protein [Candidatus Cloacimonadota bacterium]
MIRIFCLILSFWFLGCLEEKPQSEVLIPQGQPLRKSENPMDRISEEWKLTKERGLLETESAPEWPLVTDPVKQAQIRKSLGTKIKGSRLDEVLPISFTELSAFIVDPEFLSNQEKLSQGIPDEIKSLNGRKVSIEGFIIPVDFINQTTPEFILVVDPMVCCFGQIPQIHEWLQVDSKKNPVHLALVDIPVLVTGTLSVNPKWDGQILTGLYDLVADSTTLPEDLKD